MNNLDPSIPVSIVICTANRCVSLEKTLASVEQSTYREMEVVIVDASDDDSVEQLILGIKSRYSFPISYLTVEQKNISVSRNVGINNSIGDIVFFLDDDAIAPPNWVEDSLRTYEKYGERCAGVGGTVRDMTRSGYPLQFHHGITNIYSNTIAIRDTNSANHNCPKGPWFNGLMGANSSYRRRCLIEISGYDEFFEYFLDETDVCLRLIRAGYEIHYSDVVVDHYPQPSHNRQDQKHLTCWYPLTKNTTFFLLKHSYGRTSTVFLQVRLAIIVFRRCLIRVLRLKVSHNISWMTLRLYLADIRRGLAVGWRSGLELHFTQGRNISEDRTVSLTHRNSSSR
jgi:glycosyltransferase involved in cell wall biosynthesis